MAHVFFSVARTDVMAGREPASEGGHDNKGIPNSFDALQAHKLL